MSTANPLHVTAAGAYEHVLNELIPVFSRETGMRAELAVANAAGVIKRLEAGEAVDVVLTSAAGIAHLAAAGLADAGTAAEVGRVGLGIAVRAGLPLPDLSSAAGVRTALISATRVAFIDPKGGGTSGPLIAKLFERLDVARQMNESGVLSRTGKDVVHAVASGDATLGLTQATELIGAKGVQFAGYLAPEVQVVSVYSGAVSASAAAPDAARGFLAFLKSPASSECFRRAGWMPV
ncbi:MAG TPA: substrate-binding domain-containing protein [Xanthobacteraceae bacterium]|nr:substrate-binding domain-containing protein [Xanthobacteraceae bacterium]